MHFVRIDFVSLFSRFAGVNVFESKLKKDYLQKGLSQFASVMRLPFVFTFFKISIYINKIMHQDTYFGTG